MDEFVQIQIRHERVNDTSVTIINVDTTREENKYVQIQIKLRQGYPPRIVRWIDHTAHNNYLSPDSLRSILLTVMKAPHRKHFLNTQSGAGDEPKMSFDVTVKQHLPLHQGDAFTLCHVWKRTSSVIAFFYQI